MVFMHINAYTHSVPLADMTMAQLGWWSSSHFVINDPHRSTREGSKQSSSCFICTEDEEFICKSKLHIFFNYN